MPDEQDRPVGMFPDLLQDVARRGPRAEGRRLDRFPAKADCLENRLRCLTGPNERGDEDPIERGDELSEALGDLPCSFLSRSRQATVGVEPGGGALFRFGMPEKDDQHPLILSLSLKSSMNPTGIGPRSWYIISIQ